MLTIYICTLFPFIACVTRKINTRQKTFGPVWGYMSIDVWSHGVLELWGALTLPLDGYSLPSRKPNRADLLFQLFGWNNEASKGSPTAADVSC